MNVNPILKKKLPSSDNINNSDINDNKMHLQVEKTNSNIVAQHNGKA